MRIAAACLLFLAQAATAAENWPAWRGPRADGVSSDTGFPLQWAPDENIAWRAALSGRGGSTPIVWSDLVLITLQLGEGPMETRLARDLANTAPWEAERPGTVRFRVEAYDRDEGALRWRYELEGPKELPEVYPTHNLASPSMVTDGELAYAWFGTGQLVALDFKGSVAWHRDLGRDYFAFRITRGHGSSPVLHGDTLWLLVDHADEAMLLALDKTTGGERVRVDRGSGRRSYATPLVISSGARGQIVVNGNQALHAYDTQTGNRIWSTGEPVRLAAPSPVLSDGVLYVNRGYSSSPFVAVGADGDLRWRVPTGGPYVSSLLAYGGLLYMATENGIASAVDTSSGERVWRERWSDAYTASPVAADGHLYFLGESGETVVVKAGPSPSVVSRNPLGERTIASPALSNGRIFIRSDEHLFAIAR